MQSTIDSEGFKGGTRGAPIMPRDAVSRTANVKYGLTFGLTFLGIANWATLKSVAGFRAEFKFNSSWYRGV